MAGERDREYIGQGLAFPLQVNPRGELALASGERDIEQAIYIVLSTIPGERVMRPEFGCRIHELVFAPNNEATAGLAGRYIAEAIGQWEPRISLERIESAVDPDSPNCLLISIDYRVVATHSNRSLVYPFYLIPEEAQTAT